MEYSDTTVILPTLNEEKNAPEMIEYLRRNFKEIKILVVDDGSSDKTREIVRTIAKKDKNVQLLDRKSKRLRGGLTYSITDGIVESKTKFAIVIDVDFQHPPEKIKAIKSALDKKYKLVVGTRAHISDWALYRRIISKTMIYMGYAVLIARNSELCDDIFSGFFGVDREFFTKLFKKNKYRFVGSGYKVLFDMLKCIPKGSVQIYEVPFTFHSRKIGKSKAGLKQFVALLASFFS